MIQLSRDDSELVDMLAAGRFRQALRLLLEAGDYARRVAGDPWEFAIEIHQFRRLGLSENDLRFLVRLRYLTHAREVTTLDDEGRRFQSSDCILFTKRTCFVLTRLGVAAAEHLAMSLANPKNIERQLTGWNCASVPIARLPDWDSQGRTLSFDGQMVKQFKWQAMNQELVLAAFQEERWPKRILDPLCPHPSLDVKRRLSDTIKCLNRGHANRLIRFRGDGTGEGILWEAAS